MAKTEEGEIPDLVHKMEITCLSLPRGSCGKERDDLTHQSQILLFVKG